MIFSVTVLLIPKAARQLELPFLQNVRDRSTLPGCLCLSQLIDVKKLGFVDAAGYYSVESAAAAATSAAPMPLPSSDNLSVTYQAPHQECSRILRRLGRCWPWSQGKPAMYRRGFCVGVQIYYVLTYQDGQNHCTSFSSSTDYLGYTISHLDS